MAILKMHELALNGKRVVIRVDFNVPIQNGVITSEKRLLASAPTIKMAVDAGAAVIVLSHLGQPEEGKFSEEFSLKPVAAWLTNYFGKPIPLLNNWLDGVNVAPGEVVLCENVRFNLGEKKNQEQLAKKLAALGDIFIMDAFATAHRAQASTHGIAKFAKVAAAGPLLMAELDALHRALAQPEHPLMAIVGGSKLSTKLQLLENLIERVDQLVVGGGIANVFLAAAGLPIGKSICEADFIEQAKGLLAKAASKQAQIPLPIDVVVAKEVSPTAVAVIKKVNEVLADDIILDIGPASQKYLTAMVMKMKTIIWNGPVGMFEFDQFGSGTASLATAIAASSAFSMAGGGDTVAAIEKYAVTDRLSYISTAGGAFLEYLQGEVLPAVHILEERANEPVNH